MNELSRIDRWLYGRLAGDPEMQALIATRVYSYVAPPGAQYPLVLFASQATRDVMTINAQRVLAHAVYQVKAVDKSGSFSGAAAVADRIDALLHRQRDTDADGVVMFCHRESSLAYLELADGVQYRYMGGLYRIITTNGG